MLPTVVAFKGINDIHIISFMVLHPEQLSFFCDLIVLQKYASQRMTDRNSFIWLFLTC